MHSSGASWSLSGRLGGSLELLGGSLGSLAMGKNGEIHKKAKGNRKTGQTQWETRWENGRTAGKLIKNNGSNSGKTRQTRENGGNTMEKQSENSEETAAQQRGKRRKENSKDTMNKQ